MFPLEQTVLPTAAIPLHIFEPRYRELARVVTARAEPELGTVMIERGREVGGADQRASTGVVARVVRADELPDGQWGILAVATRRIRVEEWLTDDPFPRAMVTDWPDVDADTCRSSIGPGARSPLVDAVARVAAVTKRLDPGRPSVTPDLSGDPALATWQASVAAGLGPFDSMRLLEEPSATRRLADAIEIIREHAELLEALADQAG